MKAVTDCWGFGIKHGIKRSWRFLTPPFSFSQFIIFAAEVRNDELLE
jgi:hypothetical protein